MEAFQNRPAVKFCVPLMLGIVLGWHLELDWRIPVAGTLCMLALWRVSLSRGWANPAALFSFLMIVALGTLAMYDDVRWLPGNDVARFAAPGKEVEIDARVSGLPVMTPFTVRWGIDVVALRREGREYPVSGSAVASVARNKFDATFLDSISYGRILRLRGEVRLPPAPRNPGDFDLRRYYLLNGIRAQFAAERLDSAAFGPGPAEARMIERYVYPLRRLIAEKLDTLIGGEEADFLKGLIVGERTEIRPEVKTSFINAGVMHILAVSGLHVAIVVFMLLLLFRMLRLPETAATVVTIFCLAYYTFLTGATASVVRSSIMGISLLSARLADRRADIYNSMALSAIVILLADAKQLFQPGFQLSYVAVFSLVYLYPKIESLLNPRIPPGSGSRSPLVRLILQGFAVSLAAGIGTLPFSSYYFGKVSVVGILANLVVVPLSNLVLAVGMLAVSLSFLSGWVGGIYAAVASALTALMVKIVEVFAALPFAFIEWRTTFWSSLAFYGALAFALWLTTTSRKRGVIAFLILLDAGMAWWIVTPSAGTPGGAGTLRATFLDVGQGDALWIEFPDGGNMLVDAGPLTTRIDAGERFILPFLRWRGIHRIDQIVLTHPHSDHLGGMPALLRTVPVGLVSDAGSEGASALSATYARLIDSLRIRHDTLRAGMVLPCGPSVRAYILHPPARFLSPRGGRQPSLNNQSVVIRIVYGGVSFFLAGDAEREAEKLMIGRYGPVAASSILKVGHHGSLTSTSPSFLEAVDPAFAVISVGANNLFQHPSAPVLDRLRTHGVRFARTDETGAVTIESDGSSWWVRDWR